MHSEVSDGQKVLQKIAKIATEVAPPHGEVVSSVGRVVGTVAARPPAAALVDHWLLGRDPGPLLSGTYAIWDINPVRRPSLITLSKCRTNSRSWLVDFFSPQITNRFFCEIRLK